MEYGEHEITYGAHPVSCAAALAMLDVVQAPGFLEDVAEKGEYLRRRVREVSRDASVIGAVRGVGLINGVSILGTSEHVASRRAKWVLDGLSEQGVLARISKVGSRSHVLQLKPPLIVTTSEIDYMVEALRYVASLRG